MKRLKNIWQGMKQRCYNPKSPSARYYYELGIKICDEWLNDFEAFAEWAVSNGYNEQMTIDRIDPDGNYEPSNCQWITKAENCRRATESRKNRNNRKKKPRGNYSVYLIRRDFRFLGEPVIRVYGEKVLKDATKSEALEYQRKYWEERKYNRWLYRDTCILKN